MGIESFREHHRLPATHLLAGEPAEPAPDQICPDIGPARGIVLALGLGTLGWVLVLGLVLLIRDLL